MKNKKFDTQEIIVTIALGGTTANTLDKCNPLRGTLKKVEVLAANDTNVAGIKVELLRTEPAIHGAGYTAVYTGDNEAIVDDSVWHSADSDKDLDVALNWNMDGNYTWRATVDTATAAEQKVYIRRTLEV